MSSHTLTTSVTLSTLSCSECQVLFALTNGFIAKRLEDRKTWYCPNGHSQWYPGKTEEQKRKEVEAQLEASQKTTQRLRTSLREAHEQTAAERRRTAAYKGALTKARKRIGKGTCPECRRHFPALREHMATQHPDLSTQESP